MWSGKERVEKNKEDIVLENKVIITNESNKNKIYEKSKNNWIIELDGSKINSWDDFYKIIQKEIDILNYDEKFGIDAYTYDDFATDIALYYEVKKRMKQGITLILNYNYNFSKLNDKEKEYIYTDIIFTLLLEWYRDMKIIYKQEKPTINIDFYILVNNTIEIENELIISVEEDKKEIDKRYLNYKTIEKKLSFFELKKEINERFFKNELSIEERTKIENKFLLNSLFEYVKENSEKNLKILLFNDNNFFLYNNIILVHIIEQILMKNYNKRIIIFLIFPNKI